MALAAPPGGVCSRGAVRGWGARPQRAASRRGSAARVVPRAADALGDRAAIKVMGVGGAGCNAVDRMSTCRSAAG